MPLRTFARCLAKILSSGVGLRAGSSENRLAPGNCGYNAYLIPRFDRRL